MSLSLSDENILLLFAVYYLVVFMDNSSFMLSLFDSHSDEDAGIDDDGADTPSVVLPAPATPVLPAPATPVLPATATPVLPATATPVLPATATPAPLVASAASAAPPAAPLVQEVNNILSGQYYFIIIVNISSIQPVISVCFYRH